MTSKSLEAKKAYIAKSRLSNYAASLRLEGFQTTPEDAELKYKTREEALKSIKQNQD
ncbi:YhfG family protein [Pseudomonas turukhanskensis]|uniref:DUF2559 domain-containing protein n=1 Tax=Pseudomonas turukhanskensis TaxID=1806536 RepID=A0A9W6K2A4_9PSED|nr:YhfG family protein [Pseudomonas turukhanskensis]GLK88156.1 hypothetical protein GCM10017655_12180 [Pseudomonas turukhanskensis]